MVGKSDSTKKSSTEDKRNRGRPAKSPVRSPAKAKKSQSPARSRKATSPARLPKTPPRSPKKSPNRASPARKVSTRQKSPSRKAKEASKVIELESDSEPETYIPRRSRRTVSKEASSEPTNSTLRVRLDKLRSKPETFKKLTEFSEDDELHGGHRKPTYEKSVAVKVNYLQTICITSVFLLETGLIFGLVGLCMGKQCKYRLPTLKDIKDVANLWDVSVLCSLAAFFLFHGLFSMIPIGGRRIRGMVYQSNNDEYIANGLFAMIINLAIFGAMEVYHIPVFSYIVANVYKLLFASFILSISIGVVLHVKSLFTNPTDLVPETKSRSHLHNFLMGSELNPRFFGALDVKFVMVRMSLYIMAFASLAVMYVSLEVVPLDPKKETVLFGLQFFQSLRIKPTIVVFSVMMIIYAVDTLVFEYAFVSTLECKSNALGTRMITLYITGGFLYSAFAKYSHDYNVQLDDWHLIASTLVFVIGFIIYRGSNSQKHAFRENPYSPNVANLESIPTSTGRKLLCSGYWGVVRHPNYAGDILITISLMQFVLFSPLALVSATIVFNLISRAYYDNKRCKERYGNAWDRYCKRVKYVLIPKVF